MPNLAEFHPIVVHFAIALLAAGVVLRLVALPGRVKFASPAATTLILVGTAAAVVSVKSGDDAHGPVERIPGVDSILTEHERWGERTRNLFLLVAALEIAGTVLRHRRREARVAMFASAAVGLAGLFAVYETGEHGGELVYSYAGGVGIRTGEAADVEHLLVAGLHHQAIRDREAGRPEAAARLVEELARRRPDDPRVQLALAQSTLEDRDDPQRALEQLRALELGERGGLRSFRDLYMADAFAALGQRDSALVILHRLEQEMPQAALIQERLRALEAREP